MGFTLAHHLIYGLFEQNLQLSFLTDITVELCTSLLEQSTLVFHLLAEGIDYSFVADDFLFLTFDFSRWLIDKRAHLVTLRSE